MSDTSTSTIDSSPFMPSSASVAKIMRTVIYALIPGICIYIWFFGWGILVNITIATLSAMLFEWIMLVLRDRPVRVFLLDGSAIITAMLLALAIPPIVPWWIPVIGSFFAIVVAKHLYGGLGYNTFNPAMAAYAVLLISFPKELSLWGVPLQQAAHTLDLIESFRFSFFHTLPAKLQFDALTSATVLDYVRTEVGLGKSMSQISQSPAFGVIAGYGYEWISLGFLAGGLWLVYRKIIGWQIPLAMLTSILVISTLFYFLNPEIYPSPQIHLLGGASILGAFFIATDPITASTTPVGRIVYGAGIGLLTYAIRIWGGYPDGVAFAVLLIGLTVPLLDNYTAPKVYGARTGYDKR